MENESRFYVGFYCVFRSTQRTVVIESFYRTHVNIVKTQRAGKCIEEIRLIPKCSNFTYLHMKSSLIADSLSVDISCFINCNEC